MKPRPIREAEAENKEHVANRKGAPSEDFESVLRHNEQVERQALKRWTKTTTKKKK
jgi:hypothetical protein